MPPRPPADADAERLGVGFTGWSARSGPLHRPGPSAMDSGRPVPCSGTSDKWLGAAWGTSRTRPGAVRGRRAALLPHLWYVEAGERRPAGEQFVQDRPQAVDVGALVDRSGRPRPARGPCTPECRAPARHLVAASASSEDDRGLGLRCAGIPASGVEHLGKPQSRTITSPKSPSTMLAGLRSRWITPREWA